MSIMTTELGWCVAKLTMQKGMDCSLTILSPANAEEHYYQPAESVLIYGRENLVKLQAFLNEALE